MIHIQIKTSPLHIIPSSSLDGSLNIFIPAKEKENACIICMDGENLIKNDKCSCIYYFHESCISKLEKSNQCLICRKIAPSSSNNNEDADNCSRSQFMCHLFILIGIFCGIFIGILSI